MSGVTIETSSLRSTRDCQNLLFHMFSYNEALKVSKVVRGEKVAEVAESDFQA